MVSFPTRLFSLEEWSVSLASERRSQLIVKIHSHTQHFTGNFNENKENMIIKGTQLYQAAQDKALIGCCCHLLISKESQGSCESR